MDTDSNAEFSGMDGAGRSTSGPEYRSQHDRDLMSIGRFADRAQTANSGASGAAFGSRMDLRVSVDSDADVVAARRPGRIMAGRLGLSAAEATLVATAISELARNIVDYANHGEIHLSPVSDKGRGGLTIVARDHGPGIADVKGAGQLGHPASGGLGLGLRGVRRIMDEFDIASGPGRGTTVTVTKWKRQ